MDSRRFMAMAAAVLAIVKNINITIRNTECVAKSYPSFFDDFKALGGDIIIEN